MSQFTGAPIFDADQHMYETPDALTRYLPEEYESSIQFAQIGRNTRIVINGVVTDYSPNPTFNRVARPGAHEPYYAGNNPDGLTLQELMGRGIDCPEEFRNPEDRLPVLDEQGVRETFMFPTLANLVETSAEEDYHLVGEVIHALNRWMLEHWTFNYQNRIFASPVITCGTVEGAQREFEFAASNGAKIVLMKPAPAFGPHGWRSSALPEFDPLWRDIEASGIPVALHASQSPLEKYAATWEPVKVKNAFAGSSFKTIVRGHRDIADMVTSLICHGTFTRFPKLKVMSVENGSDWIGHLFDDFESLKTKNPKAFEEDPIEVFRRNMYVSPFWEGKVSDLVELVGDDRILFGSDYPHPEGLAEPIGYYNYVDPMDEERTYDVMGDNSRRMIGLPTLNPQSGARAA